MNLLDDYESLKDGMPRVVVRLTTSRYSDDRGLHFCKELRYLRRKCEKLNFVEEDVNNIGAPEAIESFVNLLEVPDGVYEVIICDISHDWETGVVDDYRFKLIPYEETP